MGVQDLGQWRVTKAAGSALPQGSGITIAFTDSTVVIAANGREVSSAPFDRTSFENWGSGRGMIDVATRQLEIAAASSVTPLELQASLYARKQATRRDHAMDTSQGSLFKVAIAVIAAPVLIGFEVWAISNLRPDDSVLDAVLVAVPFIPLVIYWRYLNRN